MSSFDCVCLHFEIRVQPALQDLIGKFGLRKLDARKLSPLRSLSREVGVSLFSALATNRREKTSAIIIFWPLLYSILNMDSKRQNIQRSTLMVGRRSRRKKFRRAA